MALMLAAAAVAGGCMMKVNINFYDILFLYRHNYTLNNSYMKDKFCLMLQLLQATAFTSKYFLDSLVYMIIYFYYLINVISLFLRGL